MHTDAIASPSRPELLTVLVPVRCSTSEAMPGHHEVAALLTVCRQPGGLHHTSADDTSLLVTSVGQHSCAPGQVDIVSKNNRSQPGLDDTCTQWVEQPTLMYSGIEWDNVNIYHFFLDNFLPMFATLTDLGLFDMDAFSARWAGHASL